MYVVVTSVFLGIASLFTSVCNMFSCYLTDEDCMALRQTTTANVYNFHRSEDFDADLMALIV